MKWQKKSSTAIPVKTLTTLILMSLFLLTACSSPANETPSPQSETKDDEAVAVMETLSDTVHEFLHPGWLHFIQQASSDTDQDQNNANEDGISIPSETQTECWFDLDEDLVIQRSICILSDPEGAIIQTGVTTAEESWITYNGITTLQDRFRITYTPEIDSLINKVAKNNPDLKVRNFPAEVSEEIIQLSYIVSFNTPVTISDYHLPITGQEYIYTFDLQTGIRWLYQEWVTFAEGDPRIATQIQYLIIEFIDSPPEDILLYLVNPSE